MAKEVAILSRKLSALIVAALGSAGLLLSFPGSAPVPVALAAAEEQLYLDPGTCAQCHVDYEETLAVSPHGSEAFADRTEHSCQACHGPGTAHLEDPTVVADQPRAAGPAGAGRCLDCHREAHPRFEKSPHASMGCASCHTVHQEAAPLESSPAFFRIANITGSSAQCAHCHEDVAAAFQYNERHRLQEGIVQCIDCHNPHEPTERLRLGGFKQEECVACHADKGGPFVFEHGAQRVEGCIACHDPHGSPNRHLLNYQRTADLCYSCHAQVPGFHLNFPADRDCLECHQAIHGSQVDPSLFQ